MIAARQRISRLLTGVEPVSNLANRNFGNSLVNRYVLARDIGQRGSIAISARVEDKRNFSLLRTRTKALGTEEHPKFEGHIEAGKLRSSIKFHDGNIMNAEPRLLDDAFDLGQPVFARVADLKCAARPVAASVHGEQECSKDLLVVWREWAIDEDTTRIEVWLRHDSLLLKGLGP